MGSVEWCVRYGRGTRLSALAATAAVIGALSGPARAEPPILSPQDAFCRSEARAKVFSAPDPLNLGLREIGRQIWASCMQGPSAGHRAKSRRAKRRR